MADGTRQPPYREILRLHLPYERGKCQWCGEATDEVTPAKKLPRMWHARCEAEFQVVSNPSSARWHVERRDHGICAECGEDWSERYRFQKGVGVVIMAEGSRAETAAGFYRYTEVIWVSLWHVDHKTPLHRVATLPAAIRIEYFKLSNLVTLCHPCHSRKSAAEARERAHIRRLEKKDASLRGRIEITGHHFGKLTVLGPDYVDARGQKYWKCECECGEMTSVRGAHLKDGVILSCGCGRAAHDLTNRQFGRWRVLGRSGSANGKPTWLVECDCGKTKAVRARALVSGASRSCGCLAKEYRRGNQAGRTHGGASEQSKSRAYNTWIGMRQRCTNPNNPKYDDYGGRGILVCDRWRSFETFLADMGEPPRGLTLDRIDNDGNYEPSNCCWATVKEQQNNRGRKWGSRPFGTQKRRFGAQKREMGGK